MTARADICSTIRGPESRADLPDRSVGVVARSGNVLFLGPRETTDLPHWFARTWSAWLRAEFVRPEDVSVAFGVRMSTACAWWHGDNCPGGQHTARAFMARPAAAAFFAAAWAARRAA